MKKFTLIAVLALLGMAENSVARQGYRIHLKLPDVKDSMVFLAHYYGKALPTIYKRDSARFDKNGNADFYTTDSSFVGGIYMMLLSDKKTYFEFLINSGDDITISARVSKLPEGITFKNSPETERFQESVYKSDIFRNLFSGKLKVE